MVPGFHGFDLIILLAIVLLIFGPKKLPEIGSAIGKSFKEQFVLPMPGRNPITKKGRYSSSQ